MYECVRYTRYSVQLIELCGEKESFTIANTKWERASEYEFNLCTLSLLFTLFGSCVCRFFYHKILVVFTKLTFNLKKKVYIYAIFVGYYSISLSLVFNLTNALRSTSIFALVCLFVNQKIYGKPHKIQYLSYQTHIISCWTSN